MSAIILDGKKIAQEIQEELSSKVEELKGKGITPGLAVIRVGEDPSSLIYVRNKKRKAEEVGIHFEEHTLKENTSQDELIELIARLNSDSRIEGIVLQLPLPDHLDEKRILEKISPDKDVDGFHPLNMGRLLKGDPSFIPATPRGIVELLDRYKIPLGGKRAVVVDCRETFSLSSPGKKCHGYHLPFQDKRLKSNYQGRGYLSCCFRQARIY